MDYELNSILIDYYIKKKLNDNNEREKIVLSDLDKGTENENTNAKK